MENTFKLFAVLGLGAHASVQDLVPEKSNAVAVTIPYAAIAHSMAMQIASSYEPTSVESEIDPVKLLSLVHALETYDVDSLIRYVLMSIRSVAKTNCLETRDQATSFAMFVTGINSARHALLLRRLGFTMLYSEVAQDCISGQLGDFTIQHFNHSYDHVPYIGATQVIEAFSNEKISSVLQDPSFQRRLEDLTCSTTH